MESVFEKQPGAADPGQPGPELRPWPPESAGIEGGAAPEGPAEPRSWQRWSVVTMTSVTTAAAMALSLAITAGTYFLIDQAHIGVASIMALICPLIIAPPLCIYWFSMIKRHQRTQQELVKANQQLAEALSQVKELTGLLPICASCKRIRDDQGYWTQLETYLTNHSRAEFTHGICPDCRQKLYPELEAVPDDRGDESAT